MSLLGYTWLISQFFIAENLKTNSVCLFKNITDIPCPSCGSTRSILEILKGNFLEALYINPLGFLGFAVLIIIPLWLLFDVLQKKHTLYLVFLRLEKNIKKTPIAIILILLIITNWIWNIAKNL
ncbi:DUF2752 domain-containing protein [Mesonia sp. K7]|uniref:DUF2752 domain-containing protein n=1 Tax=Mesonia sp. K7 TaxID=2218606 RepID=UPI00131443F1|nr:DUF2752 domain-containing protein [Mesonia sp. K7]